MFLCEHVSLPDKKEFRGFGDMGVPVISFTILYSSTKQ
jgi:hypothetical protein